MTGLEIDYSDTDSLVLNGPLPESTFSPNLTRTRKSKATTNTQVLSAVTNLNINLKSMTSEIVSAIKTTP